MAEERAQRRLAAVLAADVVGYSRLMEQDESDTLTTLKARRKEVLAPLVTQHQGRIFKFTGDGVLVEFSSAVNAVQCAINLQHGMAAANANIAEARHMVLRIGVNLGDVMVEGDDLYGDGVNIAARLESIAESGEIVISGTVFDYVRNKVKTTFEDLGMQTLKNIAEPVRVYRLRLDENFSRKLPPLPEKPSLAVLPFDNLSGDPEYFADGVVEDIITALAHFSHLFVIARNSSFTYKGRMVNVKQIGRELGVRYVVEGSVRKAGDRLRITAQLIDASTAAHLWAGRFDGTLAEVFELQDQVATSIVGAITPRVEIAEIERANRKPTENLDAYDYYLRGLAVLNGMLTREATVEALGLLSNAILRDPEFAPAYARAAQCYAYRKFNGWMVDRPQEIAEAIRLARKAIKLGKQDAVALSYSGFVLSYFGELDEGAACVDRALILNPNSAAAWGFSSWMKNAFGEPDAAIKHAALAMRLSPLDPRFFAWQFYTALAHFFAGRYDDAISWAERSLRDQPNNASVMRLAAASHALAGRLAEARQMIARLYLFDPTLRLSNLADVMPPFRRPEDRAKYVEGLRTAGLPE